MAAQVELGRLDRLPLRNAWTNEAADFTPWLAREDNIRLLGDAVGLELAVEAREQGVGPFRADIVCRNLADDSLVLIENQIERTDHSHLGQLLTYAAGLSAVTIIWIADAFTAEHRAAVDWLNRITDLGFNFFGIEIELWRIHTSPAAPKFNIVCQPNDWARRVAEQAASTSSSPIGRLQSEYWTQFKSYLSEAGSPLRSGSSRGGRVLPFALGRSGFSLWAMIASADPLSDGESAIRVQVTIEGPDAGGYFRALQLRKDPIEARLGESLTWYEAEAQQRRRIFVRMPADIQDKADWPRQHRWLKEKLEALHGTFSPEIRELVPVPESATAEV